jgi:hypothetical protein
VRVALPVPAPTNVGVELVAWNEARPDPAGDRSEFAVADECANLVLGAAELSRNLTDGQWGGPVHAPIIPETLAHTTLALPQRPCRSDRDG